MHRIFAPAKLNLALHILKKRDDGYHELSSLVCFAQFGDVITFTPKTSNLEVLFTGEFSNNINSLNNSVIAAIRWFESHANQKICARIEIQKNIPVEAGLGGGTADCAAMINFLCEYYGVNKAEPADLVSLGADVPVSFFGCTAIVEGIGEKISRAQLDRDYGLVLVNPRKKLSTKDVFSKVNQFDKPIEKKEKYSLTSIRNLSNSMESAAIELCPEIGEIIEVGTKMKAELVKMTGSGASVLILTKLGEEKHYAEELRDRFQDYWIISSQIKRSTT